MTWWSTSCRKLQEAKPGASYSPGGGIKTTHWFWGSAKRINEALNPKDIKKVPSEGTLTSNSISAEQELNDLVLKNPMASGAALVNAMQAKGLKVVKAGEVFRLRVQRIVEGAKGVDPKKFDSCVDQVDKKGSADNAYAVCNSTLKQSIGRLLGQSIKASPRKEADSGSAFPAVQVKSKERQTIKADLNIVTQSKFREATSGTGIGPNRFKVVLIQEGLGNFNDANYYHRSALESAISVFTGAKIYADHPSTMEEEIRPERSVRDVLGHFENLLVETDETGRAMLSGEVNVLPERPFEWAHALLTRAIENAKKFPEKDFVGLSINASGESIEASIDDVLRDAPESAKPKLIEAKEQGIESVKVVSKINTAVSCDLVTEPGAGGKIINSIEGKG